MSVYQPSGDADRLSSVDVAVLGAWEAAEVDGAQPADALFRLHYAPLAGWCRRMVGDDEAAHDIAAEAFVRLLGRWTTVTDPRAYLYTTALNLVRDRWRRNERERAAIRKTVMTMTTAAPAPSSAPELRMVIESLPKRLQQVVVLHYFADLSVDAVAHALGVAPGTVKRDLYDARAKLQVLLAESR
ncbi:MAG TPA: RNA polymerase sigma factor [Mycobacteriales bacterium]|nr:RNA polymerase sigma factor [Mycobacteriales bacterium]